MRPNPILSPLALAAALVLLIAVGWSIAGAGGHTFAPGHLSAVAAQPLNSGGFPSHAAIGDACEECHTPWRGLEAANCTACHTAVGDQLAQQDGLHGRLELAECRACHSEHKGADFDQLAAAQEHFVPEYHAVLYALDGRHADVACADCHPGPTAAGAPRDCLGCHAEPEAHAGQYGLACANCHTPDDWEPAQMTVHPFPLDHAGLPDLACEACHVERYVAYSCLGCHVEPEMIAVHPALSAAELAGCVACHEEGTAAETEALRAP